MDILDALRSPFCALALMSFPMMLQVGGCAIARSEQARAPGVTMGQPIHQISAHIRKQIAFRSPSFAMYGDVSGRIATILNDLFPQVEVYAIDESFVSFDGIRAQEQRRVAIEARARILQWVGVPCCVGVGRTKTQKWRTRLPSARRMGSGTFAAKTCPCSQSMMCGALGKSLPRA